MNVSAKGVIQVLKDAPKQKPETCSRGFMVAMLKRAQDKTEYVLRGSIEERIKEARESGERVIEMQHEQRIKDITELHKRIDEFEKAAGVKFGTWGPYKPENIGKAVAFLNKDGIKGVKTDLAALKQKTESILNHICETLNSVIDDKEKEPGDGQS